MNKLLNYLMTFKNVLFKMTAEASAAGRAELVEMLTTLNAGLDEIILRSTLNDKALQDLDANTGFLSSLVLPPLTEPAIDVLAELQPVFDTVAALNERVTSLADRVGALVDFERRVAMLATQVPEPVVQVAGPTNSEIELTNVNRLLAGLTATDLRLGNRVAALEALCLPPAELVETATEPAVRPTPQASTRQPLIRKAEGVFLQPVVQEIAQRVSASSNDEQLCEALYEYWRALGLYRLHIKQMWKGHFVVADDDRYKELEQAPFMTMPSYMISNMKNMVLLHLTTLRSYDLKEVGVNISKYGTYIPAMIVYPPILREFAKYDYTLARHGKEFAIEKRFEKDGETIVKLVNDTRVNGCLYLLRTDGTHNRKKEHRDRPLVLASSVSNWLEYIKECKPGQGDYPA